MAQIFKGQSTLMFETVEIAFGKFAGSRHILAGAAALITLFSTAPSAAQTGTAPPPPAGQTNQAPAPQEDPYRFRMPAVNVTAQKEPEDIQKIPVIVTAVSKDTIENADIHIVSEAAIFAPNTFFTEWSARKLSTARFRGIGSSPNNPGITTYIDGVPQLNANSSSIELLDVDQIEFVRGPQSALFGRNTLGGLVNVAQEVKGYDAKASRDKTMEIYNTIWDICDRSKKLSAPTYKVADIMVEEKLAAVGRTS